MRGSIFALCLFLTGCGARTRNAPEDVAPAAAGTFLSGKPDFAFVVRLDRLRDDAIYGPIAREWVSEADLADAYANVIGVDGFGSFDGPTPKKASLVGVLRSPSGSSPLPARFRKYVEENKEGRRLPSGVWELATLDKDGWPLGFYGTASEWVLLMGRAAGPGHEWFSSHASAPPAVDFGEGVLVGLAMSGDAMKRPALAQYAKEAGNHGLKAVRVVLRDGAHADLVYDASYATADDAAAATRAWKDSVGMYASYWARVREDCPALKVLDLDARQDGAAVHARVTHIPEAMRGLRACVK